MTRTLPANVYTDPLLYERERQEIFARTWQYVGHVGDLIAEGSYIACEIAGFPVAVVNKGDGLAAFHNVCRHRAGRLLREERGQCEKALECTYHGWTYALDGRLRNARDFGPLEGFDPRDFALFPLKVATWRGFVFIAMKDPALSLAETLAPLDARLEGRSFDALMPSGRLRHQIACNWKLYVENYLEGYHIPNVHPALAAEVDAAAYRVRMEGQVCFHEAPLRHGVRPVYDGLWAWVAPNLGVNVYGEGIMLERMLPQGLRGSELVYDYFFVPAVAADEAARGRILNMSETVTAEDKAVCEEVQRNIEAGAYVSGVLSSRHEQGVAWFQNFCAGAYR
ncbi:MAG: Rieske 2Fe-2S domain-containing protein [Alphaproteobacteria bacterium]|nr:Rieske 2Fe-2S domain-containing protein [Alphaproteobacteria bacterium]